MARPKPKVERVARSIRFTPDTVEGLDQWAADNAISATGAVNLIIREHLSRLGYLPVSDKPLK